MVQKINPRDVIWVQSNRPQAGHLSEKKMMTQLSSIKMSMYQCSKRTGRLDYAYMHDVLPRRRLCNHFYPTRSCIYVCRQGVRQPSLQTGRFILIVHTMGRPIKKGQKLILISSVAFKFSFSTFNNNMRIINVHQPIQDFLKTFSIKVA